MNKLGDYCLLVTKGTTPTTIGETFANTGVNFIKIEAISDDGMLDTSAISYISESTHKKLIRSALSEDDVLISIAGNLGRIALVNKTMLPANVNQAVAIVRLNKELIYPKYVFYYLRLSSSQYKLKHANAQSVQQNINLENIRDLDVDFVAFENQKKIADTLSLIDSKISNNTIIASTLESLARDIYNYWFVQFDFPDENGRPYKSSGGKMVWNEELKREIPEGWKVKRIGDVISTERGISYSTPNIQSGNGVPMLNLATFKPGGGEYKADGLKHFLGDYPENKVLKPYELIMCNTQQTAIKFETDIIGRAMLVPDIFDGDVVSSHHVNVIRTENEDLKYYLLYLFNSDYYHKYISGFTNGTNILGLSFSGVEDYRTEIASKKVLKEFGEIVLGIEKKKSEILRENQQLSSLRDFLLPMLMNGQVKVESQ